ncbi:MAG: class D sortase [Chloroflexi bacterium]|jgi:sortase A|nr:class D sortase [Chloroflexota bacterium]MBT3671125.1 class D sortase [Chloroflexota bacterium]MBT4004396.1 class D sortase [Chloroflexota bacterium]MBT4304416.1 class D sortase [Chloroflexota bacterium]MBT4534435.1 class D sortase [Chloroflexota bacterium]
MPKKKRPEDLSERELHRLLIQKRRKSRRKRLDDFRRSGRIVEINPIPETKNQETWGSIDLEEDGEFNLDEGKQSKRKKGMDRALLFVEIIAIVGLVFILFNGMDILRKLNQEFAAALEQPALTPTPLITAIVLPSGHTSPNSLGGAQFNMAEIPEHLQPIVQTYFNNLAIPTPSPEQATRIEIPAINVNQVIVQGDGWEQLKKGVGQHIGTANPGEIGNLVLSAHNDIFGEIFRHLDRLQEGDQIIIHSNIRSYTYVINIETQIVDPAFVQVMDPTLDPSLTLISCYPYLINNERIIVKATLVDG